MTVAPGPPTTTRGPMTVALRGARRRRAPVTQLAAAGALAAVLVSLPIAAAASTSHSSKATVVAARRGGVGTILVTTRGAALYRYTPDGRGAPTCTGACAQAWPPLLLPSGTKTVHAGKGLSSGLGVVKTTDGRLQVTYDRMPLYRYAADTGTSVKGQGVGGIWFVVHPKGSTSSSAASTATTARSSRTTTTAPASGGYGGGY